MNSPTLAASKLPEADYGFEPSTKVGVWACGLLLGDVARRGSSARGAARGVPTPTRG